MKIFAVVKNVGLRKIALKALYEVKKRRLIKKIGEKRYSIDLENFNSVALLEAAKLWRLHGSKYPSDKISEYECADFDLKGVRKKFSSWEEVSWNDPFKSFPEYGNWIYEFSYFYYLIPCAKVDQNRTIALAAKLVALIEAKHPIKFGLNQKPWLPIIVAIRSLTLFSILSGANKHADPVLQAHVEKICTHISLCNEILFGTVERYLGFNHEAFGLVSAAVIGELRNPGAGASRSLAVEAFHSVRAQVGVDGFQLEGSPTYHLHVLHLAKVLSAAKLLNVEMQVELDELVGKMAAAAHVVMHPDGDIALFSDSALNDAVLPSLLGVCSPQYQGAVKELLENAGYVRLQSLLVNTVFDVGSLAPSNALGHAHVDFLAIEVSWRGQRLVVDPGVKSYSAGQSRYDTRSINSHNSPRLAGEEPAELFGAWRFGRYGFAKSIEVSCPKQQYISHAGQYYDHIKRRPVASRQVLQSDEELLVVDMWHSCENKSALTSFLVPQAWRVQRKNSSSLELLHLVTNIRLGLDVQGAATIIFEDDRWNPKGAMTSEPATLIKIFAAEGCITSRFFEITCDTGTPRNIYEQAYS